MSATKATAAPSAGERAHAPAAPSAAARSPGLGQQLGNQHLLMMLRARALQAKLSVSDPHDGFEQEADRIADQIMRMPDPGARIESRSPRVLQRVEASGPDAPALDAATEQAIQSLSGRGRPLPASVRSYMEPRFDADFSAVRVHDDAHAHELARAVNAQAFTVGTNLVFGAGRYSPHSESGKRLLAHELTHVVQQSPSSRPTTVPAAAAPAGIVRRAVDTDAGVASASAISSAPLPNPFADPAENSRGPTLDDLANGVVPVDTLKPHEVRDAISEVEGYLARQRTSSFKQVALEKVLGSLYRRGGELNLEIAKAEHKRPRRVHGRKGDDDTGRKPRVLAAKSSVLYASPDEVRDEYDLVIEWLARPTLTPHERRILSLERINLEQLLDSDEQRRAAEKHAARISAALTATQQDPAAALVWLAQTIDGIRPDPQDKRIHWLFYQGEALGLSAEQAAALRANLATQLQKAAVQLFDGAAAQMKRYDARVQRNEDHWIRARLAEIFEGHLFSSIHDPIAELYARFPRMGEDLSHLRTLIGNDHLVEAAALLPEVEALYLQIRDFVDKFENEYKEGEARAITTLEITAAVAAAVALGVAAAALAPAVAGYIGGAVGAGGLGWTGIGGAIVTTVGSVATTGVLLGSGAAVVRGGVGFGVSLAMGGSLSDAWNVTKEQAAQGFYEGLLAGAGAGAGAALGRVVGVGTNLVVQAARRAGTEAIVNGTITLADRLARGASLHDAIEAATHSALLSVPGSLVGSGNLRKLIAGTMTSAGSAYLSARWDNQSTATALQQAGIAVATHLAVSRVGHGNEEAVAKWARRGARHVTAARGTARDVTAAVMIGAARLRVLAGHGESPSVLGDHVALIESAGTREPVPTPDPVPAPARVAAPDADPDLGPRAPATKAFALGERELQHLAAEVLRRPIKDLDGKVHFYKTQEEYETEFRRKYPKERPPRGYFEPETGDIHVSPRADVETAVHETTHSVREGENRWGRAQIGDFLDEGATDALVRGRKQGGIERSAYKKNVAFYHLLERTLGGKVVERAILHGEYVALRAKVRELFGGSEARTFEFFNKLRAIGARVRNPAALDEAVAMLEAASGRPAWRLTREGPSRSPVADSPNARIEKVGPFSFLGVTRMRGGVMYRRVAALTRSGGPVADGDLGAFMKHMIADAKAAGASRLRLFPEFIEQPKLAELELLAGTFGGDAKNVGSIYKIEIPISDAPAATTAPRLRDTAGGAVRASRIEASETEEPSGGAGNAGEGADAEDKVMDDEEYARRLAETPELTSEQRGDDVEGETIGEYVIRGTKTSNGPVFHRTIEDIDHIGGPTLDPRPLKHLIGELLGQAADAGATTLRISGVKVENPNVRRLTLLARSLQGSFRVVDKTHVEIEVPVPRRPDPEAAAAEVDTEVTERTTVPFEESPDPDEPGRYSRATKGPEDGDDNADVPSDRDAQHAAAEAFRQPMRDLRPWTRRYRTMDEYTRAYARTNSHEPLPLGYFDPEGWTIRLPPRANMNTVLHEDGHLVSFLADETSRQFVGGFLDEGFTQATVNAYLGHDAVGIYETNIAFYRMLTRALGGSKVLDGAILFARREPLVARLRKMFGGNKALTERFLERVRNIGPNAQDSAELGAAVAMIEDATGRPAWEMAPGSPGESRIASSIPESRETFGPHTINGSRRLDPQVGGNVLVRLITSTNLPAAELTPEGLRPLFQALATNARLSDATRLRVYPRFLDGHEIGSVRALAEHFGGSATRLNGVTEIEIPVLERARSTERAAELGLPQKSFVLTHDDVFEEFDPTRTVAGLPPDEYFGDFERYAEPGSAHHAEYLKSALDRLRGGGNNGGPSGSSAPSSGTPPSGSPGGSGPPPQGSPQFKYRAEVVGDFTISATRELEGNVLYRRVEGLFGHAGPQFEWGPIKRMFLALLADARAAGAARLRLIPEKVYNNNVLKLRRLIEYGLGPDIRGTVRENAAGEMEIDLPLPDATLIHDPAALPRHKLAAGEIEDSLGARPPSDAEQVTSGPTVFVEDQSGRRPGSKFLRKPTPAPVRVPAIVFKGRGRLPNGEVDRDHIITVFKGQPAYVSSGESRDLIVPPGTPTRKTAGEIYPFFGVQEQDKAFNWHRGRLIKHLSVRASRIPVHELEHAVFVFEGTLHTAEEVNAWLLRNGAIPFIDIEHFMGWIPPDPE